ncbi:MAG: hypothetical protein AAF530_17790, partial [Pseudomonadota bacterium]
QKHSLIQSTESVQLSMTGYTSYFGSKEEALAFLKAVYHSPEYEDRSIAILKDYFSHREIEELPSTLKRLDELSESQSALFKEMTRSKAPELSRLLSGQ